MKSKLIKKTVATLLDKTLLEITGPKKNRNIYLTFDDGPTTGVTDKLLGLLSHYNAKATFFLQGEYVDLHRELAARIAREGHTLGNHSYSHPSFDRLNVKQQYNEINKAKTAIQQATGISTNLFRVPHGRWTISLLLRLQRRNIRCIHWTIDSLDYVATNASEIIQRIVQSNLKPGQILLFHDDSVLCLDIMEQLLPTLIGMEFNLAPMEH